MIIFALIFVYMVFSVTAYIRRDKVQFYEVQEGSIVNNKDYTGIILRQEEVKNTDRSGYVNYYVREGKRASIGTRVYSIDETGSITSFLAENSEENVTLTQENLSDLKKQLTAFSLTYDNNQFRTVYDTKYALEAEVMEYMNFNALDNLDGMMDEAGINFQQVKADQAGIVSYGVDSFEGLQPSAVSEAVFDRSKYVKTITKSGKLIEKGAPVYKVISSDLWSVVFPMTEEDGTAYGDKTSLTVDFSGRNLEASGSFSVFTGTDGKTFGKLDFDKYMVQFASDRYVDFEIVSDSFEGLKIPVTAVTKKEFFLVPEDYMTQGGDSTETGFHKEVYSESGTSVVFVPTEIYYSEGGNYYIEMGKEDGFKAGDYILKPDSTERYQIGTSASLQGVYNINKGYAVFKQIDVLASNDEYYTVKKNMAYGLAVYDHIVLDAASVNEGELIYQ
ncbi:HlyD family efflux transporter periplasmic adaptor subunit [Lachnospiraceae bacterium 54-53]